MPATNVSLGYSLSSEEHPPLDLVRNAQRAEALGFEYASISDHFHPWIDAQGHSPFVWSVLGAIAQGTSRLRVVTGVTCPTFRIHPAIVAQAAATVAAMMPGRFQLGVGSGEALNEHITGMRWPPYEKRAAMLEEAVAIIRELWAGDVVNHDGEHFTVENARIYTLPDEPPPVYVAAAGPEAAELAGRVGDGLICSSEDAEVVRRFDATPKSGGGTGRGGARPHYLQVSVCWAKDEAEARRIAHRQWPIAGLRGEMSQILPTPTHFEQAAKMVSEEDISKGIVCGPDPDKHLEAIQSGIDAGYDHIHIGQVGPDQEGFFRFYEREVLPKLRGLKAA
ncbi:MAG: TIGR03557 family F420-dependent LLM class oxidoreductase [Chloroflexota bacterium]